MKRILGLDLGTNSIGWSVVSRDEANKIGRIEGIGSRIIPMSQDILGNFDKGNSVSQTAERTAFRGTRRLRERHLLRRERLHRVLHIMGFLPEHYEKEIDFEKRLGQFKEDSEPKLPWKETSEGRFEFLFFNSFNGMLDDFARFQPQLLSDNRKIPYDWTIYYLRKKALQEKIGKEELAWIILNFNQKRGYYQLRGEEDENKDKLAEYYILKIVDVTADEPQKGKEDIWYNLFLENGWVYRRSSKTPLFDWVGKEKEFIVTTDLNDDGSVKKDKDGNEKRSFRAPAEDDWNLLKKKTEADIDKSHNTVGVYIYETLLSNPRQKVIGKLIRTIERKYYKDELRRILDKQREFHPELRDCELFEKCISDLYPYNESHRNTLQHNDFTRLFLEDIIFYQRPLKSKKSLISNCSYEFRCFKIENGINKKEPLKCLARSNPLFQEFRLWQFIHNLRIYEREKMVAGKLQTDVDVTRELLPTSDDRVRLFEWLNDQKEIKQDKLLTSFFKVKKKRGEENLSFRWNYVEDKAYPCNETRGEMLTRLSKAGIDNTFLNKEIEYALWHILYSVEDKIEIEKALTTFSGKYGLNETFIEYFVKFSPFKKEYGAYSEKAIKKLLPLMRMGKYWDQTAICKEALYRIAQLTERLRLLHQNDMNIEAVSDDEISRQILKSFAKLPLESGFYSGLNTYQACYAVYGRHSESGETTIWRTPEDIDHYLHEFKQHSLRNPIVEQVITETLRVVRDIWRRYGDLSEIHLELGREMKNPADKRARMTKQVTENENTNLRIKALLMELTHDGSVENVRPYSPNQQEILRIYEEGVLSSVDVIDDDILKISRSAQPSRSELIRYKLWLEQKYRSPYTGAVIPLGRLFTSAYEIEHIIPQSRYFDDSFSNKVICEAEVNRIKGNQLGYEFVNNHSGEKIELNFGKVINIMTIQEYEKFVKDNYRKIPAKMKKLLMEDVPESFIERQLNDSRYISKVVKGLLSNIVREENESEETSKNLIVCGGAVTNRLKQDWGLNDVWSRIVAPRFERLNQLTGSNQFGGWTNKMGKQVFQIDIPLELQRGFNKKRIDHRHHALDALIIACASRSHVNYLNNESARKGSEISRYDLRNILCFKTRPDGGGNYSWQFHKPWETFTQEAQSALEDMIISFKQNKRVINKSVNFIHSYRDENGILQTNKNGHPVKVWRKQVSGSNWAIRKPLHKDTVAGIVNLRFRKQVNLSTAIDEWENLVDKDLKVKIKQLLDEGLEKKKIQKFFSQLEYKWLGKEVSKPEVYYFSNDKEVLVASRTAIDATFNSKKIESITDSGIRKILSRHLEQYNEEKGGKIIERPDLAFSPEGIAEMNNNRMKLNGGRPHQPIYKVRTFEPKGNKFNVGSVGNKKVKFVESAKGTNLFFAIYVDSEGNRSYETIPLNVVIERLGQGLNAVPEQKITMTEGEEKELSLLFFLSPHDLVYVPTKDELEGGATIENIKRERVYKMVSSSDKQCFFIPNTVATPIVKTTELGPNNKSEKSWDGIMIKQCCFKLNVDRLGNFNIERRL